MTDQLRAIVERIERLDEEIKALNRDKADAFAEAKASGFDVPALKEVLKRLRDGEKLSERDALVELYLQNLGSLRAPARVAAE